MSFKKLIALLFLAAYSNLHAQQEQNSTAITKVSKSKLGLKAGYVWSYATAENNGITFHSMNGYMAGAFFAAGGKGGRGFRSEIVYSHQGYSYENGGKNTDILNDYIYLPQLKTFGIGKVFQLQLGAQIGFLINAKKSSSGSDSSMMNFMNRLDYGFAAGIELNPVAGLILGGRYNLSLGKMYKKLEDNGSSSPNSMPPGFPLPFDPDKTNLKNGIIQIFLGYKF